MTNQTASTDLTTTELGILDALDTLTNCPVCDMGNFALALYREDGRVKVECGTCGDTRDYVDAHTHIHN